MSGKRYPEEFKTEAVKQVIDRGHPVSSVATPHDITPHSRNDWIKKYGPDASISNEQPDTQAGIRQLKKALKRVADERDIKAEASGTSASGTKRTDTGAMSALSEKRTSSI